MGKAKPTGNTERTTISIPRELKKRMEAAGERVNWSEVASRAFEAKLLELASRKETETMEDVIARLRAAGEMEEKEGYHLGAEAGRRWARENATPGQLRRLSGLLDDSGWGGRATDAFGWPGLLWGVITDDSGGDRYTIDGFWEQHIGDEDAKRLYDESFAIGFAEGAVEIWAAVEDKL